MELKITDKKVRAIAAKHPNMKDALKEAFPKAFPVEYVDFKYEFALTLTSEPIYIGLGNAPNGLESKCIMVDEGYSVEVREYCSRTYIAFKKLNP